ncbi:MAG TPA: LPS assembly protein LptD [Phycisphaerales bacterium]|nr:LPS assembly protein LptD [Phycisphaerales bacterium]
MGDVTFRAARVYDWTTDGTRRLVLEGDVAVRIAAYSFRAQRAAVWVREIGVSPDNRPVVQVFAYFDELGEASEASGLTTFNARSLPVRAVVELSSGLSITADATFDRPFTPATRSSEQSFAASANDALLRSLRQATGAPEDPTLSAAPKYTFQPSPSGTTTARRWHAGAPARRGASPVPPQDPAQPTPAALPRTEPTPATTPEPAPSVVPAPPADAVSVPTPQPATVEPLTPEPTPSPVPLEPATSPVVPQEATPAPTTPASTSTQPATKSTPRPEPIFATSGTVTIASGDITVIAPPAPADPAAQPAEAAITAVNGVTVLYRDLRGRALQLSAQRAVIFLNRTDTGPLSGPIPASSVRGIYLEGAVAASDGTYHIRSPQIYYDLVNDKAVMLDAVFSTYSQERGVPLYVRAKEIRQESARQWTAKHAVFTNSAFQDPELSIGASSVTIQQRIRAIESPSAIPGSPTSETFFWATADNVTLRAVGVPFFYWPTYAGDPSQPILKDLRVENRSGSGVAVKTTWNAAQLIGFDTPEGTSVDLLADMYFERGPAIGSRVKWDLARHKGDLFAYMVPLDNGTDMMKSGVTIDREDEFRGILSLQDRFVLDRVWTITAEGSYISDEAFIDAFFEESGETRREFANRVTAFRREDNTILALELKTKFNDFIANEWLLQSPGYTVSKLPEASYIRIADDLFPRLAPGVLTHFHEYRIGAYALALDEVSPRSRGFDTDFLSQRAFGLSPDQSIGDALRDRGYTEEQISRIDTRQEVTAKLTAGPIIFTPFVTARATFYDNTFAGFTSNPEGNDATRLWTSIGARASTTLTRIYDGVDSQFLDIHRLRHTITPSITLWAAGTNVEAKNIPSYDPLVDSLADGQAVRLGLAQTFQTKRGGPGRWIDTDLLRLNTDLVFASDDTDAATPLGRFFDSRPEYSALGNYFVGDAAYRLTDATSLVGSTVYDFDTHQQDMSSGGIMMTHSPGWSTLIDVRYLNPQDSTIVGLWGNYDLLDKYAITLAPSYDAAEGQFQSMFVQFTRRFSAMQLSVGVSYNDITSETTFGIVIQPYGARRGGGLDGLGSSQFSGVYGGGGGGL